MAIPSAKYKLKILDIKYYKNNRLSKTEKIKVLQSNYPYKEKFQVEIKALVYNIKYRPTFTINEKFHKNIKTIIEVDLKFYISRYQYTAHLINNNTGKIPYEPEEDEIVCGETEKLYRKFENLTRGDKLEITAYNQYLTPTRFNMRTNIIKNKGEPVYIQDVIDRKYELQNNIMIIDKLREYNESDGLEVDDFNVIKPNPISKIWSYIQFKMPIIPKLQYHIRYRHKPKKAIAGFYISVIIIILTIFPQFPNSEINFITRIIALIILAFKQLF